jgi:hypothetical protein
LLVIPAAIAGITRKALTALNGMLLAGVTTAFLFAMIQKVWHLTLRGGRHDH